MFNFIKNPYFKYPALLITGIAIGVVFYPTKNIEEKLSQKYKEDLKLFTQQQESITSSVLEQKTKLSEEYKQYRSETEQKVSELTIRITTLQSRQSTSYFKLVKPDGTIEERQFSESEVNESSQVVTQIQQEFKQKVESIESKWEKIHTERLEKIYKEFSLKEETYLTKISELEKSKITTVNPKSVGVEAGYNSSSQFYLHSTFDVFGPVFFGGHLSTDKDFDDKNVGAGIGVRF
jgi:hypothetical protein